MEDNPGDAQLLLEHIEDQRPSIDLKRVADLAGALRELARHEPDALLLDLGLPDSQGVETLERVRRVAPDVPVVVLTGHQHHELAESCMAGGAEDYLVKGAVEPFVGRLLHNAVARAASRRRLEHVNRVLESMHSITRLVAKERAPEVIAEKACQHLVATRGYRSAAFILASPHGPSAWQAGWGDVFATFRERIEEGWQPPCMPRALESGELVLLTPHRDCSGCPLAAELRDQTAACVAVSHCGRHHGLLSVVVPPDIVVDETERGLLRDIASDLALALQELDSAIELRETERRLRASEEQLYHSQRLEAVGHLAGGVAHDFNNLLTVINSYADMAAEELDDGPLKSNLHQIIDAGERAAKLTRQLLAFSSRQHLEPQRLELNTVIESIQKLLRRLIGEDVRLETVLASELPQINADPGLLEQVLMNLAVNARDAMPRGGTLRMETTRRLVQPSSDTTPGPAGPSPGTYVVLKVSDTGIGMSEAVRARIFEPFFTTKDKDQGTGLGLATVYGIVRQSGGAVSVESTPAQGTTFEVLFPAADGERRGALRSSDPLPASLRGDETVLVVEDEAPVRELVTRILRRGGYQVFEAADGEEALERCDVLDAGKALLLTDVVMPRLSGQELAEKLRAHVPALRVLFMSGHRGDAMSQHGLLEDAQPLLRKPFRARSLLAKVREVLDA